MRVGGWVRGQSWKVGSRRKPEAIWKAKSPPPTYEGRDRNSVWRAAAAERIERFREGDLIGPEMPVRVEAIAELAPDVAAAFDE